MTLKHNLFCAQMKVHTFSNTAGDNKKLPAKIDELVCVHNLPMFSKNNLIFQVLGEALYTFHWSLLA